MSDRPVGEIYHLPDRPKVICHCGSTRFMDYFNEVGWVETLKGHIILSVGVSKHLPPDHGGESLGLEAVEMLDELHWRKIDLSDEVLVLNVGGYIGHSTRREIEYAEAIGVEVRYLESVAAETGGETNETNID